MSESFDELDAALAGPEPDWDTEPEAPPDAEHADGMLFRLRMLRRERDADRAAAETRISQIVSWQAEREGRFSSQESWIVEALERYHRAVLRLDPRALTIHLPSGDLPSRMGQAQWDIDDEKVIEWLVPQETRDAVMLAAEGALEKVEAALREAGVPVEVLRVAVTPSVALDRAAFKAWATRRDEKDQPKAWGVTPSGETIPGVEVAPPTRLFPEPKLRGGDEVRRFDDEVETA